MLKLGLAGEISHNQVSAIQARRRTRNNRCRKMPRALHRQSADQFKHHSITNDKMDFICEWTVLTVTFISIISYIRYWHPCSDQRQSDNDERRSDLRSLGGSNHWLISLCTVLSTTASRCGHILSYREASDTRKSNSFQEFLGAMK